MNLENITNQESYYGRSYDFYGIASIEENAVNTYGVRVFHDLKDEEYLLLLECKDYIRKDILEEVINLIASKEADGLGGFYIDVAKPILNTKVKDAYQNYTYLLKKAWTLKLDSAPIDCIVTVFKSPISKSGNA